VVIKGKHLTNKTKNNEMFTSAKYLFQTLRTFSPPPRSYTVTLHFPIFKFAFEKPKVGVIPSGDSKKKFFV